MNSWEEVYLRWKYWITDFFNGGNMWKSYKEVMYILDNKNLIEGNKIRQRHLDNMLFFATHNLPFYKPFKGCKLEDFPVINKQIMLQRYDEFVTPVHLIPGQVGKVHIQKTSGSTGTPFKIYQDTRCRIRRIATIKAENEAIRFHSFEPMMHLRAIAHYCDWGKGEVMTYNKNLNIYYVDNADLTDDKLQQIVDAINKNKIKVIRGYMTSLDTLTQYAVRNHIEFPHHPFFISVGELLLESLRLRIVDKLHCHIISQYGNEENGIFGSSKIDEVGTTIWLNRANCFVEILKLDTDQPVSKGELGRIVVTDFTNYAMPIIRYELGDLASIGEVAADGTIMSIDHLCGRKTDMIFRTNGEAIDIFNSIPAEIYNNQALRQWQFIQTGKKTYTLRLSLETADYKIADLARMRLKQLLGNDADITVQCVDEIPVLNSGKRKIVINQWKNNS